MAGVGEIILQFLFGLEPESAACDAFPGINHKRKTTINDRIMEPREIVTLDIQSKIVRKLAYRM